MTLSVPQEFMDDDIPQIRPIESGNYDCLVMATSWEDYAKIPDTKYLLVELKIVQSGPGEGQKIYCRFNLYHPSQQAKKFSWALLKQLAMACGQKPESGSIDPDKFDGEKVRCNIKCSEHVDYGTQLDVKKFFARTPQVKQAARHDIKDGEDLPW